LKLSLIQGENMTKAEFVASVAEKTGLTKVAAAEAVDAFVGTVSEVLKAGDKITLPGFGTFSVSERAARKGRNPQTGAEIQIAASKSGKFSAGKDLKGL
jgi:DNA-binding protein HU-beta